MLPTESRGVSCCSHCACAAWRVRARLRMQGQLVLSHLGRKLPRCPQCLPPSSPKSLKLHQASGACGEMMLSYNGDFAIVNAGVFVSFVDEGASYHPHVLTHMPSSHRRYANIKTNPITSFRGGLWLPCRLLAGVCRGWGKAYRTGVVLSRRFKHACAQTRKKAPAAAVGVSVQYLNEIDIK